MSREGKVDLNNNPYEIIQEMFCRNTDKIKEFKASCTKYDMTDIIMIPILVNYGATNL